MRLKTSRLCASELTELYALYKPALDSLRPMAALDCLVQGSLVTLPTGLANRNADDD